MAESTCRKTLPNEVLENILAHLPISDLFLSKCLVSKNWNDIISRKGFILWKKRYHSYRLDKNSAECLQVFQLFVHQNGITEAKNCLKPLIKFMAAESNLCLFAAESLKAHPKFSLAIKILEEIFEEIREIVSLWAVVAVICIVADDVWDVYSLFNLLANSKTAYMSKEIMEKLYFLATFLLYFQRTFGISFKFHYNIIYALHLYENCWNTLSSSRPSNINGGNSRRIDSNLTQEQLRIINHCLQPDDLVKVVAYAGTGKTTTLVNVVKTWPKTTFLILYFNKSMADDACVKFPSNAICMTVHKLAREPIMNRYPHLKLKSNKNLFPSDILKALGSRLGFKLYVREKLVVNTVNRFFGSEDEEILVEHCPATIKRDGEVLSAEQKQTIVIDAKAIWEILKSPLTKSSKIKHLPHDAYLKLFQLERPNLYELLQVDVIIIDEGQDMSGSMLGIFNQQKGPRMIVGDPAQQIYQWRYAVNALDRVSATHTFYLTQSFRFGPAISFLANALLSYCTPNHNNWLVGANIKDNISSAHQPIASDVGQLAYIARTNSALFQKAVQILQERDGHIKIAFAGGLEGYNYENLSQLNLLRRRDYDLITHPYLTCFKYLKNGEHGYQRFTKQVEAVGDAEWSFKIELVNWAEDRIDEYVRLIKEKNVHNLHEADFIFTTTHKSKGMEWDTVCLLDDFSPELLKNQGDQEEANVLYVAATRAKRHLVINPACFYTLLSVGERFEKVIGTENQTSSCPCKRVSPSLCAARAASISRSDMSLMALNKEYPKAVDAATLCSACAGFTFFSPPQFQSYNGARPLPCQLKKVEKDGWRLPLQFILGPKSQEDKQKAKLYYDAELARLQGGFIQANQLLMGIGPVLGAM